MASKRTQGNIGPYANPTTAMETAFSMVERTNQIRMCITIAQAVTIKDLEQSQINCSDRRTAAIESISVDRAVRDFDNLHARLNGIFS